MLSLVFVRVRDGTGRVACLSDVCIHRGASLSKGRCEGDRVACPFHGWEFDGEGRCQKIPALGDTKVPKRGRIDSYPTKEIYGWIWVFLGDLPEDERPEPPTLDRKSTRLNSSH